MVKKLLGDAVREERLRRNLSQNSLAEQAKISLRTVSDIENYIGNPQLETLYALATYLHISIDAIFSKPENEPGFYHAANHGRTKFLPGGAETACPFYTAWTSGWIQEPKLRLSRILHHLHIIQRQSVSNL